MEHEDFVTFDQAMKLKDLGFDWKCNYYYVGNGDHPTLHESTQFYMGARSPYVSEFYHNFNDLTNRHGQPGYPRCSAPTLSQVQKWLREVKGVKVYIKPLFSSEEYEYCISFKFKGYGGDEDYGVKKTWESALSAGINEAIKLVKKEAQRKKRWYE